MEKQRLDKIIASTGRWSRREVKELARRGLVMVDGLAIRGVEEKFDPAVSEITVNTALTTEVTPPEVSAPVQVYIQIQLQKEAAE